MTATEIVIAVHGGAGRRVAGEEPDEAAARRALEGALDAGHAVLAGGGAALDAVQAALLVLEDAPCFNAGRGAVLNAAGEVELDASLMDGATGAAGALGAVRTVRNPVLLARAILEDGRHTLLMGPGAEAFSAQRGVPAAEPGWHVTGRELARFRAGAAADGLGTVGAVARDARGHLAAGTSTGGRRGSLPGRVGDSAVVGAGTWADARCALSLTGDGDAILRHAAAHEVAALVRHAGLTLPAAVHAVLHERLAAEGLDAGVIGIAADGTVVLERNCDLMHRGVRRGDGPPRTAVR